MRVFPANGMGELAPPPEVDLARCLCAQHQLPMIPLSRYEIDAELLELLDRDFTWEHGALPLSRIGSVVIVAIPDVPPAAAIQTQLESGQAELKAATGDQH